MSPHFTATVLLDRAWSLDIDAIAAALRLRFDGIGHVEAIRGQSSAVTSGVIRIDGGQVVVTLSNTPLTPDDMEPPLRVMRSWTPARAISGHQGHLTISGGGALPGLDGAVAYAAAVHFVAAAAASISPAVAVFWNTGYALTRPDAFDDAAKALLSGRIPQGCWASYAAVVPRGYRASEALGMVTYGMRPFIGRELELAPRAGDIRSAHHCVSTVAGRVLGQGLSLTDGDHLRGIDGSFDVQVRERTYWLRRQHSAYVLVADDAVVASDTLRPQEMPALSA